jgi:hypothetical protein
MQGPYSRLLVEDVTLTVCENGLAAIQHTDELKLLVQVLAHTTAHGVTETQLQAAVQHCMAAHDADGDGCLAPSEFQDLVLAASQPAAAVAAH